MLSIARVVRGRRALRRSFPSVCALLISGGSLAVSPAARADAEVPARPTPNSVRFVGGVQGVPFRLQVGGLTCDTPCTLPLAPGYHWIAVAGPRTYRQLVLIPTEPAEVRAEAYSPAAAGTGIGLMIGGLVTIGAGAFLMIESSSIGGLSTRPGDSRDLFLTGGIALIAVGFNVMIGVGLPLIVLCGRDRLVVDKLRNPRAPPPPLKIVNAGLSVSSKSAIAALTWSF